MAVTSLIDRHLKRGLMVAHDAAMTGLALALALALRFDGAQLDERLAHAGWAVPFVAVALLVYHSQHLYRSRWRFASVPDLLAIARAVVLLTLLLLITDYLLVGTDFFGGYFFGRQVIVIYALVQMALLGAPRLLYRAWKDRRQHTTLARSDLSPVFLMGKPGDVEPLLRAAESGALRVRVEGILSPRSADVGERVRGANVLGTFDDLERETEAARARGRRVRRIVLAAGMLDADAGTDTLLERARRLGLQAVWMGDGPEGNRRLEPVAIEDLLLRPTNSADAERLARFLAGARVAVTGGGGSIGGEICRRLKVHGAEAVLIVEHSEPALHAILDDLARIPSTTAVEGRLGDVRDRRRLDRLFAAFRPDVVIHAAALKQVHYLETEWDEAIRTNVEGSLHVTRAAIASGARAMVMISTDKSVRAISILGATKRVAELLVQHLDRAGSGTRIVAVRFGNVLGSNGSVVPVFKRQIAEGGPVTVTHPDMVRYFMTIREACDLVLTAASHAGGARPGEGASADASIYVLHMGQPIRIMTLAERMIALSGLELGKDITIAITGLRPGERLTEHLFREGETLVETGLPGVMAARSPPAGDEAGFLADVEALIAAAKANDRARADSLLRRLVDDYQAPAPESLMPGPGARTTPAPAAFPATTP